MSYQSPIELIMSEMNTYIQNASLERDKNIESTILKAIENAGVNIDKGELIRAICYDRNQYQKGYNDRNAEIVRCRDCKYGEKVPMFKYYPNETWCHQHSKSHNDDWYCADAERRNSND